MNRTVLLSSFMLLLVIGAFLLQNGCGTAADPPIQHVVIIFQENRTPDNLFHDPVLIAAGADIASSGINSKSQRIPLLPLNEQYDPGHAHSNFVQMCDRKPTGECAMDGADLIPVLCIANATNCPPPNPQFAYVDPADVKPYFQLAEQYTFADRMFQTNQGPSFPAHQFILSGTSAPSPNSKLFVAENPSTSGDASGCTAPPNTSVLLIDPDGQESSSQYPCFEHATLPDLLNQKGLSWRYYVPLGDSDWTAPNAIEHMCRPNAEPPNATACLGPDWTNNVVLSTPQNPAPVLTDISNGSLSNVSWVIPTGTASDHPPGISEGPSWVAAVVNAIGHSQYWRNTVIFITWDDWGGWYDHVPPPKARNSYEYGFRVPLIVVSPYARRGYISHVQHDFGSILKFVEVTFGLPSLGYADAPADDLSDCFDYSQQPLPFQTINAPLGADFFIHDTRPPQPPDDD